MFTIRRILAFLFITAASLEAMAIKLEEDLESSSINVRDGPCGADAVLIISLGSQKVCMNQYVFLLGVAIYSVRLAAITFVPQNWAATVKKQTDFTDLTNPVQTRDFSSSFDTPDWEGLGVNPVSNPDGTISYKYERNDDLSTPTSAYSAMNVPNMDNRISSYSENYTQEGFLKSMEVSLSLDALDDQAIDKREQHSLTYSYGATPGHDKTDLDYEHVRKLFKNTIITATDNEPGASAFCGHAHNSGNWQGYFGMALDGQWGDCWMFIQNNT